MKISKRRLRWSLGLREGFQREFTADNQIQKHYVKVLQILLNHKK